MNFISPLLFVLFFISGSLAQGITPQKIDQIQKEHSITVENYDYFLASIPNADQYYNSAMQDQIQRIEEEGLITYCIIDGENDQPMSGLTDAEIDAYYRWSEAYYSTDSPLMMFGEYEEPQDKKTDQQRRQQGNESGSFYNSSNSDKRSSFFSNIREGNNNIPNEKTSLLTGQSSSSYSSLIQDKNDSQTLTASNQQTQKMKTSTFTKNTSKEPTNSSSYGGTNEERQPLLEKNQTRSSSATAAGSNPTVIVAQQLPPIIPPLFHGLVANQGPSGPIRTTRDVRSVDSLLDRTRSKLDMNIGPNYFLNELLAHFTFRNKMIMKEREQPRFTGIAPQTLFLPHRIASYLIRGSLGERINQALENIVQYAEIEGPAWPDTLARDPAQIRDDQIPEYLEWTQKKVNINREIAEDLKHLLDRLIEVEDSNMSRTEALSKHFVRILQEYWLWNTRHIIDAHNKARDAESLIPRVNQLNKSNSLTYSIQKMRSDSTLSLQKFIKEGRDYLDLCKKDFFQRINNENSRLSLLNSTLRMKDNLETLHTIDIANKRVSLSDSSIFTYSAAGGLEMLETPRTPETIRANEQIRDEAYRSYRQPVFNRNENQNAEDQEWGEVARSLAIEVIIYLLEVISHIH
jgi:hypothetical protein